MCSKEFIKSRATFLVLASRYRFCAFFSLFSRRRGWKTAWFAPTHATPRFKAYPSSESYSGCIHHLRKMLLFGVWYISYSGTPDFFSWHSTVQILFPFRKMLLLRIPDCTRGRAPYLASRYSVMQTLFIVWKMLPFLVCDQPFGCTPSLTFLHSSARVTFWEHPFFHVRDKAHHRVPYHFASSGSFFIFGGIFIFGVLASISSLVGGLASGIFFLLIARSRISLV